MLFTFSFSLLLSAGIFAQASMVSDSLTSSPTVDPSTGIFLASDISEGQKNLILKDLKYLSQIDLRMEDAQITRVMEIRDINGFSLQNWLRERVSIIVSQDLELSSSVSRLNENFQYPNTEMPDIGSRSIKDSSHADVEVSGGASGTVMSNIGAMIYYQGKIKNRLYGINIPGFSQIAVRSPRVGIIKIGDELFAPSLKRFGLVGNNIDLEPYTIQRLGTFFHEARHSDGNGKSLSFPHAVCPAGHDFEGGRACDQFQNGAYTVGGLVIKAFLHSCKNCSVAQREVLKLKALDSFNRVLSETEVDGKMVQTKDSDPSPEGDR